MTSTESSSTGGQRVSTERIGRVLVVRLDRPTKRNAIDTVMTAELDAAFNELDDDPDLWCGVLSGGPRFFCAGTDLLTGPGEMTPRGGRYGVVGRSRRKPLIAAVEGFALGGGLELTLAADAVIAGRTASFGLPEVSRGVVANSGALFRAHQHIPLNVAKQMLLTGQPVSADRAYTCGFVNELVDDGTAEAAAISMAQAVAANAPIAVQQTLRAVEDAVRENDSGGWEATAKAEAVVHESHDLQEGLAAFRDKRTPVWSGR